MSYDGKIMRQALARFEEDKQRRAAEFTRRRDRLYETEPRLKEIEQQLRATMPKLIASALRRGADPLPAVRVLQDENLDLQRQRMQLLTGMGYPADYLEEKPACPLCGDTGYHDGQVCRCLREYYKRAQLSELSRMLDLGNQSFETFSFDWYSDERGERKRSPRENMERVFDICQDYARHFSLAADNLLLTGQSGLGKTFLSASIARVVSDRGFSVVYDTAEHIFSQMEEEKFRPDDSSAACENVQRYQNCDLLIVDDLGTEMVTSFVQSALYQLINGRLLAGKKTVINTNLAPRQLGERYSPQVQSRLEGEYRVLPFFGEDIRKLRRRQQMCTSHVHSGQVGGQSAVGPHLHLPQSLAPAGDGLEAAEGINGQLLLLHTVGVQPLGHAADAVAAHPALAAVGVEDAHHGIRPGGARCADADDAVCPDGKMPPGQLFRKGRDVLRHTGCAAVQIDIIVGAALHFGK